jgi:hypothetical protein
MSSVFICHKNTPILQPNQIKLLAFYIIYNVFYMVVLIIPNCIEMKIKYVTNKLIKTT